MSNYKWVTYPKAGETVSPLRTYLRREDFTSFCFPNICHSLIDTFVEEELLKAGIAANLACDFGSYYYELEPINPSYVTISAPLYRYDEDTDSYVQIADSFTGGTIDPAQYDWVKEEFNRCAQRVREQQAQKFLELFHQNSLDGGLTARIEITGKSFSIPDGAFMTKYLTTEDFFEVCRLTNLFDPDSPDICLFMKYIDAMGGVVTIKVPERLKALTIGRRGQNIKRVASQINARRINVI